MYSLGISKSININKYDKEKIEITLINNTFKFLKKIILILVIIKLL